MALQLVVKSSELRLVKSLADLKNQPAGWMAVHFHLSQLLEEYKSEYQFKIAINLIHDLLKHHSGYIYVMVDNSIIVLCYKLEKLLLDKLIFQMRYLYMDDPLCYNDIGQENPDFCTVYDLNREWKKMEEVAAGYSKLLSRKTTAKLATGLYIEPETETPLSAATPLPPLMAAFHVPKLSSENIVIKGETASDISTEKLVGLERRLRTIDLRPITRRQPVCAVLPDMRIRRVFDELYINISHLRNVLQVDGDFLNNRWLFKYLTHILDQRMIDMILGNSPNFLVAPISLNLNIETLLSSAFTHLDNSINPASKVSIIFEVPVVDLFSDMRAFKTAMHEVQKRGYRICLDGLSTESFMSIDREKIGLDLIKVQWNSDLVSDIGSPENAALKQAITATGNNRIILCRCDNKSALEYGMALGISLFQGRYLDHVLNPTSKIEN